MTSGDRFSVRLEALARQAGSLDAIADEVETARAAAASVQMGRDAYGGLPDCRVIPSLLDPLQERGTGVLAAAVDKLQHSADALRAVANAYGDTDAAVSALFTPENR